MSIKVQLKHTDVDPKVRRLMRGLGREGYVGPLRQWRAYYVEQVRLLFKRGHRHGLRWTPIAASTRAARRRTGVPGNVPFHESPRMVNSIKASVGTTQRLARVVVSSGDRLVGIHHKGATIPARVVVPRRAKVLRFWVGGKVVFARKVSIPQFELPARPILFVTQKDREKATALTLAHVRALEKAATR